MDKIRSDIMGPQHEDIKYLKSDNIGVVISKGLSETFEKHPKNPIEFFAKWLLNYRQTERAAEQVSKTLVKCNCFRNLANKQLKECCQS